MLLSKLGHIAGLALVASALTVSAQASEQIRFHLPVAAHWGNVVLQPGDYNVSVPAPSLGQTSFYVAGNGHTIFRQPASTSYGAVKHPSQLKLVEVNGEFFIQELSLHSAGKQFSFAVPRDRSKQVAKSAVQTVPLSE